MSKLRLPPTSEALSESEAKNEGAVVGLQAARPMEDEQVLMITARV